MTNDIERQSFWTSEMVRLELASELKSFCLKRLDSIEELRERYLPNKSELITEEYLDSSTNNYLDSLNKVNSVIKEELNKY